MKITPNFYANVKNGKMTLEKPENFQEYLKSISGTVLVVLKKPQKPRSNNENNYYWFLLELIGDEIGYTRDEMHEAFKMLFLRKMINEKLFTVKSTATLNTLEFEDYLEKIRRFSAQELNINLPLPNEYNL